MVDTSCRFASWLVLAELKDVISYDELLESTSLPTTGANHNRLVASND
jgi:hypothetical protein